MPKNRKAFSMVELIFVIVVLGIVASIGSETIAQVYRNMIPQKASFLASSKSELAAEQIANRLSYAVPWSIVAKTATGGSPVELEFLPVGDTTHTMIEWIGMDGDSFEASATQGWSGYCDVDSSTAENCPTHGSNLINTDTIIKKLGGTGITDAVALFSTGFCTGITPYSIDNIGLTSNDSTCAFPVTGTGGGVVLTFNNNPKIRADIYKLAWSAYALVPGNWRDINGDGVNDVFDLQLRYNYQPWQNEGYANASSQVIMENVSVFRISQSQNTIRFKICVKQPIGGGGTEFISMCKEKAVIR